MLIHEARDQDRKDMVKLLQSQKLPSDDLPASLNGFFTVFEEGLLVGLIGMDRYGSFALLRSMVVHPAYRNRQIAEKLVAMLEEKAIISGLKAMYLLTETAENYFAKKGYEIVERKLVPQDLLKSTEFSHVCPVSAIVMKKQLIPVYF
jgi:amino-acid N-acetyltransferase